MSTLWIAAVGCSSTDGVERDDTEVAGPGSPGSPGSNGGRIGETPDDLTTPPRTRGDAGAPPVAPPAPPVVELDGCPGPLSEEQVNALTAGGSTNDSTKLVYPYDQTVFPSGLPAPVFQWVSTLPPAEAVMVHATSDNFEYRGCTDGSADGRLQLPRDAWDQAFVSNSGNDDPLRIEVTTLQGGEVIGPMTVELILAKASLKGAVYYNTYNSPKAALMGKLAGVVMRVLPGEEEPDVFVSSAAIAGETCVGCHSVSADGTRMVAEEHAAPGLIYVNSWGYELEVDQAPNPTPSVSYGAAKAAFSALYPDGSRFLTTGRPEIGPFSLLGESITGTFGIEPAMLWDANTGEALMDSGIPAFAKMPMFNVAGDKVAFTDQEAGNALALMDFDPIGNKFSNHRVLATDTGKIGWPFFLPDDSGMVFSVTLGAGYGSMAGTDLTGLVENPGTLSFVDLDGGDVIPLARAMGYRDLAMSDPYVPQGPRDLNRDYLPTVSPVAAGGYFWMFFTSKRTYGTLKNSPVATVDSKQIWVSAISIPGSGDEFDFSQGNDPSHPPFWLPGQELESGNIRAFASLTPCLQDGDTCNSGIDCCGGFCERPSEEPNEFGELPAGTCTSTPPRCARVDEACSSTADCCDTDVGVECLAGFCAFVQVVK